MRWGRLSLWVFATLCLAILASPAPADNWPRFRGPNGSGIAGDKDVPVTFGTSENLIWKVPIPGVGNGSPIVWGKHIFVQSASKNGKDRTLYCLGAAYTIAPQKVEQFLEANWPLISSLITDHGPWEGDNVTRREAIRFQTSEP